MDLEDISYKGKEHRENRVVLSGKLLAQCHGLAVTAEIAERCAEDDDDLDALICALVARAAMLGLTEVPAEADLAQARREGWIHVPSCELAEIFDPLANDGS